MLESEFKAAVRASQVFLSKTASPPQVSNNKAATGIQYTTNQTKPPTSHRQIA